MMVKTSNIKKCFLIISLASDPDKLLDIGNHDEGKVTSELEYDIQKAALITYALCSVLNVGDKGLEGSLSGTSSNIKKTQFIFNFKNICVGVIETLTNMYITNLFTIKFHTFESIGEDRGGDEHTYRAVEDVILTKSSISSVLIILTNEPILTMNGLPTDSIVEFRTDADKCQIDIINKEGLNESVDSIEV